MPRPRNSETRRAQIVDGLRAVLPERGFAGASIQAIARAAGLGAGLVHYHFDSKQEILLALVQTLAADLQARIPEAPGGSPRQRLHAWVDAWLGVGEGADPQAVRCWVVLGAEAVLQEEVRAVYGEVTAAAVNRLEALLAEARPDRSEAEVRQGALALHATIEGFFKLSAAMPGLVPPGGAAPAVRALVDAWLEAT